MKALINLASQVDLERALLNTQALV